MQDSLYAPDDALVYAAQETLSPVASPEAGKRFYIESYGCQMNFSDSEIVASILSGLHYRPTRDLEQADLALINTCSIREKAEETVRKRLSAFNQVKKKRPGMMIGVLGCMAERLKSKFLEEEKLVDLVVGPDAYRDLPTLLADVEDGEKGINVFLSREEPDTEPYEKQRAFAIAARTYAAHYMGDTYRKFPGKPYDGSDSPAIFQKYTGKAFEKNNPRWLDAVAATAHQVLTINDEIIRPPYFSSDDGRTRSPSEVGWKSFPFIDIFTSKPDPWCDGMENRGHGVGMSGCGAEGQANEGKTGEEILEYYYPGTTLRSLTSLMR